MFFHHRLEYVDEVTPTRPTWNRTEVITFSLFSQVGMSSKNDWIVIATFDSVASAQVAQAYLAANDIIARIEHEFSSTIFPSMSISPIGVQLKVHWKQGRQAYELLEAYSPDADDSVFL